MPSANDNFADENVSDFGHVVALLVTNLSVIVHVRDTILSVHLKESLDTTLLCVTLCKIVATEPVIMATFSNTSAIFTVIS